VGTCVCLCVHVDGCILFNGSIRDQLMFCGVPFVAPREIQKEQSRSVGFWELCYDTEEFLGAMD
jgi:hypothetical protein